MGIVIGSNFDLGAALPLDSRGTRTNTTTRDAIPAGIRYEGLKVYAGGVNYQLRGGITNGDWKNLDAPAESTITFTDITTNNATTGQHGFLPKLGGGTTNFLRADGTWAAPGGTMVYPGVGIALSTGSAWNTSIAAANIVSLATLSWASGTYFVKMTGANTFALDSNAYSLSNHDHTGTYPTLANGADNRLVTFSSASALNGEANLTFDGTILTLTNGRFKSNVSYDYTYVYNQFEYDTSDASGWPTGLDVSIRNTHSTNKKATAIRANNWPGMVANGIGGSHCFLAYVWDGGATLNAGLYVHGSVNSGTNGLYGIYIDTTNGGTGVNYAIYNYRSASKVYLNLTSGTPSYTVGVDSSGNLITYANPSGGGSTTYALTMNNSGSGAASGTTFNGSAAVTLSYNTIGAAPSSHDHYSIHPRIQSASYTNPGAQQWLKIAYTNGGDHAAAKISIYGYGSGNHAAAIFYVTFHHGQSTITQIAGDTYSGYEFSQVRTRYFTADRTYGGCYFEALVEASQAIYYTVEDQNISNMYNEWIITSGTAEGGTWTQDRVLDYTYAYALQTTSSFRVHSGSLMGGGTTFTSSAEAITVTRTGGYASIKATSDMVIDSAGTNSLHLNNYSGNGVYCNAAGGNLHQGIGGSGNFVVGSQSYSTISGIPSGGNIELYTAGAGVIMKNESSTERWHLHVHGNRLRQYDGSSELTYLALDSNWDTTGTIRYHYSSYVNTSDDTSTTGVTYVMAKMGDNFHRSASAAKIQTFLGLGSAAYVATSTFAAASHTHNYAGAGSPGAAATEVVCSSSDANSTYNMLWRAGNSVYYTAGIYCNPSADYIYAADHVLTSDLRLKENISPISLEPIEIEYRQFVFKKSPDRVRYGVIAQDLMDKYPELVMEGEGGMLSVSYHDLHSREIAWMKPRLLSNEQRIKELEIEVEELKKKLN